MTPIPSYEVLSYDDPAQRKKWNDICHRFHNIDIFYCPEYVYLFEINGDGKAHCFVYYESSEDIIIYPFHKRPLKELACASDIQNNYFDITTPYGYGGFWRSSSHIDVNNCYNLFKEYCRENHIISHFIRFNPLMGNHLYCPSEIITKEWNKIVVLDLNLNRTDLWNDMTTKCHNNIRKSQKNGVTIIYDDKFINMNAFYSLYCNTMKRLNVRDYYCFSSSWFDRMIDRLKGNLALFHAIYQNNIILSAIFLYNKDILHYFLSGSSQEFRNLGANNGLIYEVALWAKLRGFRRLNLGGGYIPHDSLFKFKSSFTSLTAPFYVGSAVYDVNLYNYLSNRRLTALGSTCNNLDFFPAYRMPDRGTNDSQITG